MAAMDEPSLAAAVEFMRTYDAGISAVRYPEDFGFIGLYIVVPEQRGRGYGIQLWNAAMQRLAGCNIGLDGVIEQQEN